MESKYYTPELEDLKIGYICQNRLTGKGWLNLEITEKDAVYMSFFIKCLKEDNLRTEYLTKANIESLGWKINIEYNHFSRCGFEKDNYYLLLDTRNEIPFIKIIYKDPSKEENSWIVAPEHFQISIQCPSINELKTILKLLSI